MNVAVYRVADVISAGSRCVVRAGALHAAAARDASLFASPGADLVAADTLSPGDSAWIDGCHVRRVRT